MNENEFASKIKPWLDRSAAQIGDMQSTKLKAARLRALDAYREPVRLFGLVTLPAGTAQTIHYGIIQRALLFVPILALLATLAIQSLSESDVSDIDAQLLTQELPPDAFIDQDFRSWLVKSHG
jgi:hypothetical protein